MEQYSPMKRTIKEWFASRSTLVFCFDSRHALLEAVDDMFSHGIADLMDIGHAALIIQPANADPVIVNNNVTAREGLISGGMIGAALAGLGAIQSGATILPGISATLAVLVFALLGAVIGGAIGRLVAVRIVFGFDPAILQRTADQLSAGEIALLLQVRTVNVPTVRDALLTHHARLE